MSGNTAFSGFRYFFIGDILLGLGEGWITSHWSDTIGLEYFQELASFSDFIINFSVHGGINDASRKWVKKNHQFGNLQDGYPILY